jgi:hypothetical protein
MVAVVVVEADETNFSRPEVTEFLGKGIMVGLAVEDKTVALEAAGVLAVLAKTGLTQTEAMGGAVAMA